VVPFVVNHLLSVEALSIPMGRTVLVVQGILYQPMALVEWLVYKLFHRYQLDWWHELYKLPDHQVVQKEFVR
jgi:hypothetical protein